MRKPHLLESKVDTSLAEAYESELVPGVFRPWAEALVAQARLTAEKKVLDVACGTGIATRHIARTCRKAVGIDIDSGMVEIATAIAIRERVSAEYHIGSADNLPFDSATFDAALCLQGLQYFPDRFMAMAELHRVTKPGANILLATWSAIQNCQGHWALVTALERRGIDASAARHPFSLSDAGALRSLAENAGFKDIAISTQSRLAHFESTAAFVEAMAQGAPSSRHALAKVPTTEWAIFLAEIDAALTQWRHDSGLDFPMASHVLEARR